MRQLDRLNCDLLNQLGDRTYAPGKWTVKEIIQHVIDWERILTYRALLNARSEPAAQQNIDQIRLAENSDIDGRTIDSLVEELMAVRLATKFLFESLNDESSLRTEISWEYEVPVLAMGFTMIGHQIHHLRVIEEKYYPLTLNGIWQSA